MTNRTRVITEGAASTVLFIILLLITVYIPFLGFVSLFFLPIPIMFFASRYGWKTSLIVLLCSVIIAIIIAQIIPAAMASGFLLIGLVMGEMLHRKGTTFHLLVGGTLSNIVILLIAYGVTALFFHINPINWMMNQILTSFDTSVKMTSFFQSGEKAQIEKLREQIQSMAQLAPFLLVFSAVFYALIIELVAGAILRRLRVPFPKWLPFREWHFPRHLIWYYFATVIIMFVGGNKLGTPESMVLINVYYALNWLMIIQGLSFVFFYFHQKKQGLFLPVLITIFTIVLPVMLYIVPILGIIDLGFDLRSRFIKKS